jgi:hypothetical protein
MKELIGNIFVWTGLILFFAQVILTIFTAIKPKPGALAQNAGYFEKIFQTLVDKFPVAALGIASVWLGSNILDWF